MPEHEVSAVDFDSRLSLGTVSAKAVVAVVAAVGLLVAVMAGCALGGDEPMPGDGAGGAIGPEELGEVPGTVGDGTTVASGDEGGEDGGGEEGDPAVSPTSTEPFVVSVQGMVRSPGLLRLAGQTRVGEAIERAGGALPDASLLQVNLAELVVDGMQIVVTKEGSHLVYPGGDATTDGAPGQAGAQGPGKGTGGSGGNGSGRGGGDAGGTRAGSTQEGLVNINTADATTLETLDGVGPATAEAIIAWREANGAFSTVEQLMEVRGIGPAKFEAMKNDVTV